ncbi:molybdopterin-dependent oxidoreductase [Novosphingobium sp. 9U]|uniref:molybdopterin-dependent oxidoreductase n=1 Tax=Novosphingobium sp. 9U TaxID=2653158 RepID=UPI0012F15982|nr:molybdopterin-dependent oxidoreductase [Novosphingobium sp. 9U]VWX51215.1 Molybdopterin-binding oxidoreductase [Novosphingobium sp. 9U]
MPFALILAAAAVTPPAGPVTVTLKLLADLPVTTATIDAHGTKLTCKGPALSDVLARIGAPQGKALHGKALTKALVAHASDGYEVLFSLGELDATLGNEPAIVATECNGEKLTVKDGPYRLLLPGDKRPARSVRQLQTLELR